MVVKGVIDYNEDSLFSSTPTDEDYELIKRFMQSSNISKDDIFVYKVLLCDNMVDRDYERFTHKALESITELYVGKVGIEDHNPTAKNTHSRIYKTSLMIDENKKNDLGDPYEYVLGYAYTLINDKNKSLIEEIKGGIKKEVSVGINNKSLTCSICGQEMWHGDCEHIKGHEYDGALCVGLMDGVTDVYEWSFVAIPSQRKAGVIKSKQIDKEDKSMDLKAVALKVIKSAGIGQDEAKELLDAIDKVEKPDQVVKSLQEENAKLKSQLDKALKEIEEDKVRRLEEQVEDLIDALQPKNDKMKELARRAIDELIEAGEDGKLTEDSEKAIKSELGSDEYKPLFAEVEGDEEVEKEDKVDDTEEVKETDKKFTKAKSIDFKHSNTKTATNKYAQKTGVMGIHFRDKE